MDAATFTDDEYGSEFSEEEFAVGYMCKPSGSSKSFVAWCHYSRNFGASPTVPAGNGTGTDDDNRMQVDFLEKEKDDGIWQTPKTERKSHKQHKQHRHQHLQELCLCRIPHAVWCNPDVQQKGWIVTMG